MIIVKEEAGKDFQIAPQGNHLACCYRIVDLGTQKTEWDGTVKMQRKLHFSFELHGNEPGLKTDDGKPLVVSKRYTLSFFETAALRQDLESWRGRAFNDEELAGFNLENVLGKFCMLNILHQTKGAKTYANIKGISPVPSLMKGNIPSQVNTSVIFSIDQFDQNTFDLLPDWMKDIIMVSPEYRSKDSPDVPNHPFETEAGDIPF